MTVKRSKKLTKLMFWLLAEMLLNFLGLDNLADYSEFIFERHYSSLMVGSISLNLSLPIPAK